MNCFDNLVKLILLGSYLIYIVKCNGENTIPSVLIGPENRAVKLTPDHSIEVKVSIGGFVTECFHEYLKPGNIFHMIYQVVKGKDMKLHVSMIDPNKKGVFFEMSKSYHWYDNSNIEVEGPYKICFRNAHYESTVVYIHIITYTTEELKKKAEEEDQFEISKQVILNYFQSIGTSLDSARVEQTLSRMRENSDYYLLQENNTYVMYYSISQIILTILSGVVQVFFIRKLFGPTYSRKMQQKHKFLFRVFVSIFKVIVFLKVNQAVNLYLIPYIKMNITCFCHPTLHDFSVSRPINFLINTLVGVLLLHSGISKIIY